MEHWEGLQAIMGNLSSWWMKILIHTIWNSFYGLLRPDAIRKRPWTSAVEYGVTKSIHGYPSTKRKRPTIRDRWRSSTPVDLIIGSRSFLRPHKSVRNF